MTPHKKRECTLWGGGDTGHRKTCNPFWHTPKGGFILFVCMCVLTHMASTAQWQPPHDIYSCKVHACKDAHPKAATKTIFGRKAPHLEATLCCKWACSYRIWEIPHPIRTCGLFLQNTYRDMHDIGLCVLFSICVYACVATRDRETHTHAMLPPRTWCHPLVCLLLVLSSVVLLLVGEAHGQEDFVGCGGFLKTGGVTVDFSQLKVSLSLSLCVCLSVCLSLWPVVFC